MEVKAVRLFLEFYGSRTRDVKRRPVYDTHLSWKFMPGGSKRYFEEGAWVSSPLIGPIKHSCFTIIKDLYLLPYF